MCQIIGSISSPQFWFLRMKTSFLIVKWDTFEKVWINFLISDDLAHTGLQSQKSKGIGEVIFGDSCWEGVGFWYVRIIYVIMVQLQCLRLVCGKIHLCSLRNMRGCVLCMLGHRLMITYGLGIYFVKKQIYIISFNPIHPLHSYVLEIIYGD